MMARFKGWEVWTKDGDGDVDLCDLKTFFFASGGRQK